MKSEFDTGFFAYRKCTIHEIFKIVPDFFLTVFSVIGNRTGQNFIHVTDKGLFSSIVDSGSDSCTENTIWLPSKIIDRNSGFSKSSGKFIVAFDPQIPGWFSEMDVGTFLKIGTACIRNSQMAACCFFFKFHNTINRGNLSKIFGELFMLIESDKRGVELQLLYKDEQFSIPSNVHIIGMMNTADRSLAMLDYALRRRFAFFDILPAFDSSGFRAYRKNVNNPKFDKLISAVQQLNEAITNDESLGEGFCVGHSYFCTNVTINDEWLKSVVEYELIPLLKEYWFDEPTKVRTWTNTLREVIK